MKLFGGKDRDEYVRRIADVVAGRCEDGHVTHPEDIENQFVLVAEIVAAWESTK